jgi:hypothetical protein
MVVAVVDRTVVADAPQRPLVHARTLALVAVVFGLLWGAMACAAGLAGPGGHAAHLGGAGAAAATSPGLEGPHDHASHLDPAGSASVPGDTPLPGGLDGSSPASHPGMACVVSVDLRFPAASATGHSNPHVTAGSVVPTGCAADVDPPVPRLS